MAIHTSGMTTRFGGRWMRTATVGAASTLLLICTTMAAGGARAADTFSNGRATAQSQVMRVAPGVGNLQLATTTGVAVSQVSNSLAQAQAQAIDLGLIGTAATAEGCDGSPGALTPDQLPKAVVVDNRKGDA